MAKELSKLAAFFSNYPLVTFEPGERFKRPNEKAYLVRYLKSGFLRAHAYTESGKDISLVYLAPEDYQRIVIGFSEKLDDLYITALTKVELWRVPKKDFVAFLRENPDASIELVEGLFNMIAIFGRQDGILKCGGSPERIAHFLIDLATKFSHKTASNEYVVAFPLTHQMIADYTGLTRETVSIQLAKLKKDKIIDYINGYVHIYTLDPLRKRIEG